MAASSREHGAVWPGELFAPLGFRKRRASFVGDALVAQERSDYAPRVDLSPSAQWDVWRAGTP